MRSLSSPPAVHLTSLVVGLITALLTFADATSAQQLCGEPVDAKLLTTPERSEWQKTSSARDVTAFLAAVEAAFPGKLEVSSIGRTLSDRRIRLVVLRGKSDAKPDKRLRVLIQGNIHGGEVEGKEVVQILIREFASGQHANILEHCDLWFVPIFNVDGNEQLHPGERTSQNGPVAVGSRPNAQGLDLNRDFVKVETPEVRALIGLMKKVDPHLFMDLHTTNGSEHGYHLTYAPSLAINQDSEIAALMHERFLPAVREAVKAKHGFRIFDYGNFAGRRRRGDAPTTWRTYSQFPRYGTNYVGLRNRLSLLSEAYSYLPFKKRAAATRAFVLESLVEIAKRKDEVIALCAAADLRAAAGDLSFGYRGEFAKAVEGKILRGKNVREARASGFGSRTIATGAFTPVDAKIQVRYAAGATIPYPAAWAIPSAGKKVLQTLLLHGLRVERLSEPINVTAESLEIESKQKSRARFQGHRMVTLRGTLKSGVHTLPAGTLIVPAQQTLSRVAAELLEAHSADGLASWNFFDESLRDRDDKQGGYPVLRVMKVPNWRTEQPRAHEAKSAVAGSYQKGPMMMESLALVIRVACTELGTPVRRRGRGRGRGLRFEGRELCWSIGTAMFKDHAELKAAVTAKMKPSRRPVILRPGTRVNYAELNSLAGLLREAGATEVVIDRLPE